MEVLAAILPQNISWSSQTISRGTIQRSFVLQRRRLETCWKRTILGVSRPPHPNCEMEFTILTMRKNILAFAGVSTYVLLVFQFYQPVV
jgi:hypothetical protein